MYTRKFRQYGGLLSSSCGGLGPFGLGPFGLKGDFAGQTDEQTMGLRELDVLSYEHERKDIYKIIGALSTHTRDKKNKVSPSLFTVTSLIKRTV